MEMVTHSRIIAWEIPWTEESGRLQSMVLQRVEKDWVTNAFTFTVLIVLLLFHHSALSNIFKPMHCTPQVSQSFTTSWSLLKLMSIELVMPSNHLILCYPFSSCPKSFPASGSFPVSQLFTSGGQNIGVSVSAWVLQWIFRIDFL